MKKILVIEDEAHIAEGITLNLKMSGYKVFLADNAEKGLELWKTILPHLVVLDLMLPDRDGFYVLQQIRQENEQTPVLILSAKNQPQIKVNGFDQGADDYLTKPFHLEEFLARIKILLKKTEWYPSSENSNALKINNFTINMESGQVISASGQFQLTWQELQLLVILYQNKDKVMSREQLLKSAWGYQQTVETRTIDNFMARLRKYFEIDPKNPVHFVSQRAYGYMFKSTEK